MSHLFPDRIETERLVLTAATVDSVAVFEFYRILSGKTGEPMDEVTEFMPWDPHGQPHETLEFLDHVTENRREEGGTNYLIRPKEGEDGAGMIAGATGIGVDWDRRRATFGAWLRKRFWGRGYSGERASAFMELAFEHLDLELVTVNHWVGNEQSRRAITKYTEAHGGGHDGHLRNWYGDDDGPVDVHHYSVSNQEYDGSELGAERAILDLQWNGNE